VIRSYVVAPFVLMLLGCAASADPHPGFEPPLAQIDPGCLSWKAAMSTMRETDPEAAIVYVDEGRAARQILAFVNALPPASHAEGDRVAVLYLPRSDKFLFVIGEKSCLASVVQVPSEQLQRFVGMGI